MIRRGFWLIITGTGRCGTGYIAHVLNSVNIKCSHEGVFSPNHDPNGPVIPDGLVTDEEIMGRIRVRKKNPWWGWQADSSWMAAPYLERAELEGMTIVHLVRDPKKTIDSMVRTGGFNSDIGGLFWQFQIKHMPELLETESRFERAGWFYTRWNERIERCATLRWRVEDDVRGLLDLLDIDYEGKEIFADTTYNSRAGYGPTDLNLNELPEPTLTQLQEMTERYGYEWTSS